jgi:glycosyltransferase involved in cell wall biosynthesis
LSFEGVDLFHSPFNILPEKLPVPAVFTLHDIMWLLDANYCTDTWWRKIVTGTFYKSFIPRSVAEARRILTVSDHSREAIEGYFPSMQGKVHTTYNGLDPYFYPVSEDEAWPLIERHVPREAKFVLVVGQGSPYKNHEGALRGFIEAFGDGEEPVHFVLIRRFSRSTDRVLEELLRDRRIRGRVVHLSYVSGEELRAFYAMARVFLFPSLYEGFGLPALEAMACGTPVITSNEGAPAEIAGQAARTVDPRSPGQIAEALRAICLDDEVYEGLREAGLARAQQFTWRRTAEQTVAVYRQVLHLSGEG